MALSYPTLTCASDTSALDRLSSLFCRPAPRLEPGPESLRYRSLLPCIRLPPTSLLFTEDVVAPFLPTHHTLPRVHPVHHPFIAHIALSRRLRPRHSFSIHHTLIPMVHGVFRCPGASHLHSAPRRSCSVDDHSRRSPTSAIRQDADRHDSLPGYRMAPPCQHPPLRSSLLRSTRTLRFVIRCGEGDWTAQDESSEPGCDGRAAAG